MCIWYLEFFRDFGQNYFLHRKKNLLEAKFYSRQALFAAPLSYSVCWIQWTWKFEYDLFSHTLIPNLLPHNQSDCIYFQLLSFPVTVAMTVKGRWTGCVCMSHILFMIVIFCFCLTFVKSACLSVTQAAAVSPLSWKGGFQSCVRCVCVLPCKATWKWKFLSQF